ncbi:MAG: response regulator [Sphingobacteriales bacterium]|nr:MAG: response regulator [Sphingobacteriales bacterium]
MRSALDEIGYPMTVIEVTNGRLALEYLRNNERPPDLIMLDINMPIMDGLMTLEALKGSARTAQIPVVVYTTSAKEEDEAFCARYGVDMITKPRNVREIQNVVRWLVETHIMS